MAEGVQRRIAAVILVNTDGKLLMQLRDGNTRIDPHRWGLPGGAIEPGEDPERAARRELLEETGLHPADLTLCFLGPAASGRLPGERIHHVVYYSPTTAVQDQVCCNEGADMRFIPADEVLALPLSAACQTILPVFLKSGHLTGLTAGTHKTSR